MSISKFEIVVYFVKYSKDKDLVWKGIKENGNVIYGLYNGTVTKLEKNTNNFPNYIVFKHNSAPQIKKLFLNNNKIDFTQNCILMLYEYEKIKNTGIICESSEYIRELQILIQRIPYVQLVMKDHYNQFLRIPFGYLTLCLAST